MIRIAHYGGWSRNYGDMAIQCSMQHLIQKQTNKLIEFVPINSDLPLKQGPQGDVRLPAPQISSEIVEYINESCQMLIVGGGGQIMSRDPEDSVSGWQFNISIDDLCRIKVPLVIFGIGYNKFPNEPEFLDKAIDHLIATYHRASFFSVRNKGTAAVLKSFGFPDVEVIPDPAMFCPALPITVPGIEDDDFVVGLNWAGDNIRGRYQTPEAALDLHIDIIRLCLKLLQRAGTGKILYFPHVSYYDMNHVEFMEKSIGKSFINLARACPWLYPESLLTTPYFVGAYSIPNLVLAARGHANIIPYGRGVPSYGYGAQEKVKFFQEDVGGMMLGMNPSTHLDEVYESAVSNRGGTLSIMERRRKELLEQITDFTKRVASLL